MSLPRLAPAMLFALGAALAGCTDSSGPQAWTPGSDPSPSASAAPAAAPAAPRTVGGPAGKRTVQGATAPPAPFD